MKGNILSGGKVTQKVKQHGRVPTTSSTSWSSRSTGRRKPSPNLLLFRHVCLNEVMRWRGVSNVGASSMSLELL